MHPTPFYGKKRKPNAINTAERTQPTAENPLVKRYVGEEEQNKGTSAVETPSLKEFGKEEEGEGKSAWKLAVWSIVVMKNNRRKELLPWILHLSRSLPGQ